MIAQELLSVCPVFIAALLLLARTLGEALGLAMPDVAQILAATKVSRSSAYEAKDVLAEVLPTLARPRGRPPKPSPPEGAVTSTEAAELTGAVLAYVMRHPGCVHRADARQQYSDGFRHFLLEQRAVMPTLDVEAFAHAARVPLGTLKDWLRPAASPAEAAAPSALTEAETHPQQVSPSGALDSEPAHIETVLEAWSRWDGGFLDFCAHVKDHLHVHFGKAFIAHILEACGVRLSRKRGGRRSDEIATRGSFLTFFPGAQWVGDGMQLPVVIDGHRITVNLELDVDAYTGAFVGVSVRDTEDSTAVIEALSDGIANTGARPLSLLLDNRPSNHTPEVDAALGDTILIRATTERPQNKAHVEGAFGLLSRTLPDLVLGTHDGHQAMARALTTLVALTWIRTMNHRPRADREGRTRADLYGDKPSDEQIEKARLELREIAKRQERARQTLEARRRPLTMALLDDHFARLRLLDPKRHIRVAIAAHSTDAILAGIAIFEAKISADTLPEGADARYLLGIVRNVAAKREGEAMTRALLTLRLDAKDRALAPLVAARDALLAGSDTAAATKDCVDRALATESPLSRAFWLDALTLLIQTSDLNERRERMLAAARRIHATFAVPLRERHDAVRVLAERLFPIA